MVWPVWKEISIIISLMNFEKLNSITLETCPFGSAKIIKISQIEIVIFFPQIGYFDLRNEFKPVKGVKTSIKYAYITFDYVFKKENHYILKTTLK